MQLEIKAHNETNEEKESSPGYWYYRSDSPGKEGLINYLFRFKILDTL